MKRLVVLLSVCSFVLGLCAQSPNARQAREIFDKVWNSVYGAQGATFHYKVNIIGIYKTEGTIWQKGKRSKYQSGNSKMWNDGKTCYVVKKKEVLVFDANDENRDKHASKFQFEPDNYNYSIADDKEGLMLTLKQKSSRVKGDKIGFLGICSSNQGAAVVGFCFHTDLASNISDTT